MFIPRISRHIFPDWNVRPITAADAAAYCREFAVQVIEVGDDLIDYGCYVVYRGVEFIVLNKNLDPEMKAWVWLHEIFHRAAHSPETSYFSTDMESKNDSEANTFAAVCMMPKREIMGATIDEICYQTRIPRRLVKIRQIIAENLNY